MIPDGRKMKFASRKQLNQQKKAEKEFNPAMPAHLSKKEMRPPAPSKRPGSGMALAGNLAASIAEEAEELHLHASCGFGAAHPKPDGKDLDAPPPGGWRRRVLRARTAAMETAFAQTTFFETG